MTNDFLTDLKIKIIVPQAHICVFFLGFNHFLFAICFDFISIDCLLVKYIFSIKTENSFINNLKII